MRSYIIYFEDKMVVDLYNKNMEKSVDKQRLV